MDIHNERRKRISFVFVLLFFSIFTLNCAGKKEDLSKNLKNKNPAKIENSEYKVKKTQFLPPPPSPIDVIPEIESISPLKEKRISINAVNAPLKQVLYSIATDLGVNLVISPDVDISQSITLNLDNVIAKDALDIIKEITYISYYLENGILYVKTTETKTFHIPYIQALSGYKVDLGGDVLGSVNLSSGGTTGGGTTGGGTTGGGNLQGNFSLQYEKDVELSDIYGQIEKNISDLLSPKGSFTFNYYTGTLVVTDKISNIKKVENFLEKLKKELSKQVLIEAKIVEIALNDTWAYGIDWSSFFSNFFGSGSISLTQNLSLQNFAGQLVVSNVNFNAILNALATTGKLETLSNPRIRVLNGQSALISTGTVVPYWEKQITTAGTTGGTQQEVTYNRLSVLDGILLGVSPYINEDGSIIMNIVPVSTKIRGEKQFVENNRVVAQAPIVELKEAGTVIKVKDGNTVIIGGLISKENLTNEQKIPFLGNIPYLGKLFSQENVIHQKKELIIFLRPHIIRGVE